MIAMFGWFSEARTFASRWNRATRSASAANAPGRILMATSRSSRVSRARLHFAHAAGPEGGENLVRAETGHGGKSQKTLAVDYTGEATTDVTNCESRGVMMVA